MRRRRYHWKSSALPASVLALIMGVIAMVVIALPRPLERSDRAAGPGAASDVPAPQPSLAPRNEAGEDEAGADTVDRQYVLGMDPDHSVPSPSPRGMRLGLNRDAGLSEEGSGVSAPASDVSAAPVAGPTGMRGPGSADAGPSPASRAPAPGPATAGGEPQPCGANLCVAGTICCNESCGTCVVPGESCSTLSCSMPAVPVSVMCGRNTCSVGEVCCNLSCGICAAAGASCDQRICD